MLKSTWCTWVGDDDLKAAGCLVPHHAVSALVVVMYDGDCALWFQHAALHCEGREAVHPVGVYQIRARLGVAVTSPFITRTWN